MARLSRRVVNMVSVDASMIVKESLDTMTVVVPGTSRKLEMTVAKSQVVRAGRALRVYVPSQTDHVLADKYGRYAKTISTAALYEHFSQPDITQLVKGSKDKELGRQFIRWNSSLQELRELGERVNAKSRWMRTDGSDAPTALGRAREVLTERHDRYQTTLVALAELTAEPDQDTQKVRTVTAELHSVERDLETIKSDVRALTQLTQQEAKMNVSDRIATQVAAAKSRTARQQAEDTAKRDRANVGDDQAESVRQVEESAEQSGTDRQYEDQDHDRDAAKEQNNEPKTLAERLAERQAEIKGNRGRDDNDGPTQGRTR